MDEGEESDRLKAWLWARPGLVPAALILLGSLLPFVNVPFFTVSLFNLPGTISSFAALASAFAGGGGADAIRPAVSCLYFLYLVPLAAVALLVAETVGGGGRRLRLAVGTIALAAPIAALYLFAFLAARAQPAPGPRRLPFGEAGRTLFDLMTSMGIGWGLIIAAGATLIVLGLWRRRTARLA
jgi:hypothetical protein